VDRILFSIENAYLVCVREGNSSNRDGGLLLHSSNATFDG